MMNAFYQTLVHPTHVPLTAVTMSFRAYEWISMLQGLKISLSVHQRRVSCALHPLIGKICHIYLDDIIIWSRSIPEHERNILTVLEALRAAKLYSPRESQK